MLIVLGTMFYFLGHFQRAAIPAPIFDILQSELNVSATKVRYHIRAMKKNGEIQRVGSTKAGTWEILK